MPDLALPEVVLAARLQFAANMTFHILFPAINIGLAWLLLYFKLRFERSREAAWLDAYRFWVKLFGAGWVSPGGAHPGDLSRGFRHHAVGLLDPGAQFVDANAGRFRDGGRHPPVAPVFWAFRIMVGMALLMLAVSWTASWQLRRHGAPRPGVTRLLVAMSFAG